MNRKKIIQRYFNYSRSERVAVFSLLLYCLLTKAAPYFYSAFLPEKKTDFSKLQTEIDQFRAENKPFSTEKQQKDAAPQLFTFDPNTATFDDFVQLGLPERTAQTILNYRNKGGNFRKTEDFKKIYALRTEDFERLEPYIHIQSGSKQFAETQKKSDVLPSVPVYFNFDPNTATISEWQKLGLPAALAQRIENYRKAGGIFRKKSDLKKIYGFPENIFEKLEDYIQIAENQTVASATNSEKKPKTESKPLTPIHIDINKSAQSEWEKLPGIGAVRAERILHFREKLGGFTSVEQVAETRGLPDSNFQVIQPFLHFETPIFRKININTASLEALAAHPYLDRRNAQLILAYREQHGGFKSIGEISKIGAFKHAAWLQKLIPYISVE